MIQLLFRNRPDKVDPQVHTNSAPVPGRNPEDSSMAQRSQESWEMAVERYHETYRGRIRSRLSDGHGDGGG